MKTQEQCYLIATQYCSSLSRGENSVLIADKVEGTNKNVYARK